MGRDELLKTRYPILLVHGMGYWDESPRPYWGRLPAFLRAHGVAVYFGGQDAWGAVPGNARRVALSLRDALRETGQPRAHLIAHSKGGLEARYLISTLGLGGCVASLTMLSTPNRGAPLAELLLRLHPGVELWSVAAEAHARRHGDRDPAVLRAGREITREALVRFNRENPDDARVYYQSWGAELADSRTDPLMAASHAVLRPLVGETDGLVAPESAKWGVYRGTLHGVSHQELVDSMGSDTPRFRPLSFYAELVRGLRGLEG